MRITDSHFAFNANHKQQKKKKKHTHTHTPRHTHSLTHIKKSDYKRHSAVLQHSPVFYQNKTGSPYPFRPASEAQTHTWLPSAHLEVTGIRRLGKVSNHHLDIWWWNDPVKLIIVVQGAREGDSHTWPHMGSVGVGDSPSRVIIGHTCPVVLCSYCMSLLCVQEIVWCCVGERHFLMSKQASTGKL